MIDLKSDLLSQLLTSMVAKLRDDAALAPLWTEAGRTLEAAGEDEDVELFVAVEERDLETLGTIVADWASGERNLLRHDREVLKRALKAFRKRLKIIRLDAESSAGGGPMSSGKKSGIVGVRAPELYPQEVWDELVRQGRLVASPGAIYELPPN